MRVSCTVMEMWSFKDYLVTTLTFWGHSRDVFGHLYYITVYSGEKATVTETKHGIDIS